MKHFTQKTFLLFLMSLFWGCQAKIIEIELKIQTPTANNGLLDFSSAKMAFYKDMEIYVAEEKHYIEKNILNSNGEVVETELDRIDTVIKVFVRQKGQDQGMEYRWEDAVNSSPKVFKSDSLFSTFSFSKENLVQLNVDLGRLVETDSIGKIIVEKYVPNTTDESFDTLYRHFDKDLRSVPFSLSARFDRERNSKMVKCGLIMNEVPKGREGNEEIIPRQEIWFVMQKPKISEKKRYRYFFEKFLADSIRLRSKDK